MSTYSCLTSYIMHDKSKCSVTVAAENVQGVGNATTAEGTTADFRKYSTSAFTYIKDANFFTVF